MSCHALASVSNVEKNLYKVSAENSRSSYRISRIVTIGCLLHADIEVCLETVPNSSETWIWISSVSQSRPAATRAATARTAITTRS